MNEREAKRGGPTDRQRGRWREKERGNANFLTFKLDHTVQRDEGVWKPIKN